MATNLTAEKVKDSFSQLLHIDGGPEATPKTVYSGTGTATALKVGTTNIEVDNIRIDGNTISTTNTNGDLILSPNGSGAVVIDNVEITGGTITGASFPGTFTGIILIESDTLSTGDAETGLTITENTISADGTDTNIDINITPKGTGEVNVTNIDVLSGKVPFTTITGLAYASFYDADTADQTGSTTAATAVEFATAAVAGAGITIASNTRITFAAAGTYRINASLQFNNSSAADRYVDIWFSKDGTNIANSNGRVAVPKIGDGGTYLLAYEIFETVTAGQYIEIYWYPENVAVTLHYRAAVDASPGVTPAIPATPPAIVVAQRIA
jgi:hypothetical protein